MKYTNLKEFKYELILDTLNVSFSDYAIPFQLTYGQFLEKMNVDRTDLSFSVGVSIDDELIGLMLHGLRKIDSKSVLYNGGTGVVPRKRGHGLTTKMYLYIIPILKDRGISSVILEVLSTNIPAIKSYKKVGFIVKRELKCYKGEIGKLELRVDVVVKEVDQNDWKLFRSFWCIDPTWQYTTDAIELSGNESITYVAFLDEKVVGYLIYNPHNNRILQIAVHKEYRRQKVASSMLIALKNSHGNEISVINIDASSISLDGFLTNIGLTHFITQYEMEMKFASGY